MLSHTAAYRKDVSSGRLTTDGTAARWLSVAARLFMDVADSDSTPRALAADAVATITDALGAGELHRAALLEWNRGAASVFEHVFLYVTTIERGGGWELAESIVASTLGMAELPDVDRGRLVAVRGRLARKLGRNDFARDYYTAALRIGARLGSDELQARAALGLGTLAQRSGNVPRLAQLARRAARYAARADTPLVEHEAHRGLLAAATKRGAYGEAISEAWEMLRCANGDATLEIADQTTLAQLLLEIGDYDGALKLFVSTLRRQPALQATLAALGGLALAAAWTADRRTAVWVFEQVRAIDPSTVGARLEMASALLECAQSAVLLGLSDDAERFRAAAQSFAEKHAFHEIAIRAEQVVTAAAATSAASVELGARAKRVLRHVSALKRGRLPRRVLVGATATGV